MNTFETISWSWREGWKGVWRHKLLSLSYIFTGAILVFLLNGIFSIHIFVSQTISEIEARTDFIIPLHAEYDSFLFKALSNELRTKYSATITIHPAEKKEDYLLPERMRVQFSQLEYATPVLESIKKIRYESLLGEWDGDGEKDFVNMAERLIKARELAYFLSWGIVILFSIGAGLIAFHLFSLVLYARQKEIEIARFVGADKGALIGNFIMESIIFGFFASFLGIVVFSLLLREIPFLVTGDIFLVLWEHYFLWEVLGVIFICVMSVWLASRRYIFR